ncbi:MAG: hypothetical protein O3C28_16930 [Proteobacteria bacterium]|nr:hypothetical protein [Pseudomonadota bacterium]
MTNTNQPGGEYCEVYDEPRHRFHIRNAYVNAYDIQLPSENITRFHRHCEDTVYFVIADAEVEESFHDKATIRTVAPCGGTLDRAHRIEPLIHQVKNIGAGVMHMVGAEALKRPPVRNADSVSIPTHTQLWASKRFRVYEVAVDDNSQNITYEVYGLLVSLDSCVVQLGNLRGAGVATTRLHPGGFIWIEPPLTVNISGSFRGFFAQWI